MSTETLVLNGLDASGPTANRPTAKASVGQPFFDTDLGQQLVWNGSDWLAVGVGSGDLLMPIVNRFAVDAEALTELAEWVLLYGEQLIAYEDGAAVAIYYGAGVLVDGVPTGPALSELTPWEPGGGSGTPSRLRGLFDMQSWRLLDTGAIPAGGGLLLGPAETVPEFRSTSTGAVGRSGVLYDEEAATVAIRQAIGLLQPFDGTKDHLLKVVAKKLVAGGNANQLTVQTRWGAGATTGGSTISDTTTALANNTNLQELTATIAAADIPDAATSVTVTLTPSDNTDGLYIVEVSLEEAPPA